MSRSLIFVVMLVFLGACSAAPSDGDFGSAQDPATSNPAFPLGSSCTENSAHYQVTFNAIWSAQSHPTDFPDHPHFSGLIGGVHNDQVVFWNEGSLASQGIEDMAERGKKSPLDEEVQAAVDQGTALSILSGDNIDPSPGLAALQFSITPDYPLVTLVSMVAPSPDWFVGVSALSLCENGEWVESKTVELQPYDAGTDSGVSFESADADIDPQIPIQEITGFPFESNGAVAPLGTFVFQRI